jgi:substrate import-associated zinc metallohydrolase lipoprotein
MTMKKIIYTISVLSLLSLSISCKKDENLNKEIVGLGGDTWKPGALDEWLYANFTKPFNMSVKYRWDGSEYDVSKTLTPPKMEMVQPLMEMVKGVWIDPYIAESNIDFIRKYGPKNYILVGSLQYNAGGTVTLGEAEGGVKVTLFNVNNFSKTNRDVSQRVLKTIHHEFTHILNQNISYQKEFPLVTPAGYTADWNNTSLANANNAGFISQYAQASPVEDFAEMASIMLTEGKSSYDAIVNGIVSVKLDSIPNPASPPFIIAREMPNTVAQTAIRKKEQMVIAYFKSSYGIEFSRLQNRVNYGLAENAPSNLATLFGNGKKYTSISVDPNNTPGMSADFMTTWATAKTGLAAVGGAGRVLDNFVVFFYPRAGELILRVNYTNSAGSQLIANFAYKVTYDASNQLTLTYLRRDANADAVAAGLVALTNYLTSSSFAADWRYDAGFLEFGRWTKVSNPNSSFFGTLGVIKY